MENQTYFDFLVRQARFGDLAAYDKLVSVYRRPAWVAARSVLNDDGRADDAAQDALIAAFKALPQLEDVSRFGPWLCTIARNRAIKLLTAPRERSFTECSVDHLIASHLPSLDSRLESAALADAMAALPIDLHEVVALHHLEEWSVVEIATFLDLPESTVKWRLFDGRRRLRAQLEKSHV